MQKQTLGFAALTPTYALNPLEKADLVDRLLSSLDQPDQAITGLWSKGAESRLDAYEAGKIKAISLEEVLSKYK